MPCIVCLDVCIGKVLAHRFGLVLGLLLVEVHELLEEYVVSTNFLAVSIVQLDDSRVVGLDVVVLGDSGDESTTLRDVHGTEDWRQIELKQLRERWIFASHWIHLLYSFLFRLAGLLFFLLSCLLEHGISVNFDGVLIEPFANYVFQLWHDLLVFVKQRYFDWIRLFEFLDLQDLIAFEAQLIE